MRLPYLRFLVIFAASAISLVAYLHVHWPAQAPLFAVWQNGVLSGEWGPPFVYRVLVPVLVAPFITRPEQTIQVYVALQALLFPIFYICLNKWLLRWTTPHRALATVFAVGLLMIVMVETWILATYTLVEAILLCVVLIYFSSPRSPQSQL